MDRGTSYDAPNCYRLCKTEDNSNLDAIDDMQEGLMPSLLEEAGELGLVGAAVPEELGGMG